MIMQEQTAAAAYRLEMPDLGAGVRRAPAHGSPERTAIWWDLELHAKSWFAMSSVTPREAALLLHGKNPNDPLSEGDSQASPEFNRLLREFNDQEGGQARTLREWIEIGRCPRRSWNLKAAVSAASS